MCLLLFDHDSTLICILYAVADPGLERSLGQVYPRTGYLSCSCHGERICMQTNTCHARTDSCSYSGMVPLADGSVGTCPGSSGPGSALDFMHAVFVGLIFPRSSLVEEKRIKDFYIYSIEK